jgi:hypothetical protein
VAVVGRRRGRRRSCCCGWLPRRIVCFARMPCGGSSLRGLNNTTHAQKFCSIFGIVLYPPTAIRAVEHWACCLSGFLGCLAAAFGTSFHSAAQHYRTVRDQTTVCPEVVCLEYIVQVVCSISAPWNVVPRYVPNANQLRGLYCVGCCLASGSMQQFVFCLVV